MTPPADATAAMAIAALTNPKTVLVTAPATVAARYAAQRRHPAAARARRGRTSPGAYRWGLRPAGRIRPGGTRPGRPPPARPGRGRVAGGRPARRRAPRAAGRRAAPG